MGPIRRRNLRLGEKAERNGKQGTGPSWTETARNYCFSEDLFKKKCAVNDTRSTTYDAPMNVWLLCSHANLESALIAKYMEGNLGMFPWCSRKVYKYDFEVYLHSYVSLATCFVPVASCSYMMRITCILHPLNSAITPHLLFHTSDEKHNGRRFWHRARTSLFSLVPPNADCRRAVWETSPST